MGEDENGKPAPYRLGHFFMAINIEFFTDLADFKKITTSICRDLQNSQLFPGKNRIYVAGEKEYEIEQKVRKQGIPIIPNLEKNLQIIQKELNLNLQDFAHNTNLAKS
jgi:LDH2 family malate/lactate/ureidoglycolate dehydrogenase